MSAPPPRSAPPERDMKSNPLRKLPTLEEYILRRPAGDKLKLRIDDLREGITASELSAAFLPYGSLFEVLIDKDERARRYAILQFESRPTNVKGLIGAHIGGQKIVFRLLESEDPGRTMLGASSLELGVKMAPTVFSSEFFANANVRVYLQDRQRSITIKFDRKYKDDQVVEYQLLMKFQDMQKGCIEIEPLGNQVVVMIHLRFPPIYFRYDDKMEGSDPLRWTANSCLRRVVDIPSEDVGFRTNKPVHAPVEPFPSNSSAKLGTRNVIRFVTDKGTKALKHFCANATKFNVLAKDESLPATVIDGRELKHPHRQFTEKLPFDVRYMLESAVSFNYILEHDLTPDFFAVLTQLEPTKATSILEHIVSDRKRIWNPIKHLEDERAKLSRTTIRPRIVPPGCVYLRKIVVTPTTVYLQPPMIETSNRIIRHFSAYQDYFLRVEFSDEGSNKIRSVDGPTKAQNALYNRIYGTLTQGVKIGGRVYQFLAYSASQLRDNSVWFFSAECGKLTPDGIRSWMGDFSHIKSIAKYGARMGQCFSSTTAVSDLSESDVTLIDDIERYGSVFTDGCGKISPGLAQKIGIELAKEVSPVAFQIRLNGSKGVLALCPELTGNQVHIRPSMKKFDVNHHVLEVIKTSGFIPSYLNRQIIILFSALGVPDSVILGLKNSMMRDLTLMESDESAAVRIIMQNWDEGGTSQMMSTMIRSGFMQQEDPMLKNLLTLFRLQMLEELSKKAKIFVPQGAYLLGIADETGQLREGEIFVKVSSVENPNKHRVIVSRCAIVRSPCFHPGDVRVVQAVNCPALAHLHDVVVFNTKGRRSLPSMCSGGDLDGDDFTVIWDKDIVDNLTQHNPMDYTGVEKKSGDQAVKIVDIQKFFVQYTVSDNLGRIANAHLALSDSCNDGPLNGKCLRLAKLHSDAVDFPKSGVPAEMPLDLRVRKYPDFMEKPAERSYESRRVLGQIYRECGKHEAFSPRDFGKSLNRSLLVNGYQEYLEDARRQKTLYDNEVSSLMNQYGVKSDLEVVSGFIMGFDILSHKREHDLRKAIVQAFSSVKKRFRHEFEHQFYSPNTTVVLPDNQAELEKKAAAWYACCYQNLQPGQTYTFAWIAWDILCKMSSRVRAASASSASSGSLTPVATAPTRQGPFVEDYASPFPPCTKIVSQGGLLYVGPDVTDEMLQKALFSPIA